jgi:antitoxin component of MazEF toxin-antitoxin module
VKTVIRRVGNSFGAIFPRALLDSWGVGEGDYLTLSEDGVLRPQSRNRQVVLDDLKLTISMEVVSRFSAQDIRKKSLKNLRRWKKSGTWIKPYDEWTEILLSGDTDLLIRTMISRDERSNRLRQSMPYVGMLSSEILERLREKVRA